MASMAIGMMIKRRRLERGLSQGKLALESGVSQSNISLYENGKKFPLPETIERLERVLGPVDVALVNVEAQIAVSGPPEQQTETVQQLRDELDLLDRLHASLWHRATSGDDDADSAIDRVLSVMDRRIQLAAYLDAVPRALPEAERILNEDDLLQYHRDVISGRAKIARRNAQGRLICTEYTEGARIASAKRIEMMMVRAAERQRDYIPRSDVQRTLVELAMLVRDRLRVMVTRGMIDQDAATQILDELAGESRRRWSALVD